MIINTSSWFVRTCLCLVVFTATQGKSFSFCSGNRLDKLGQEIKICGLRTTKCLSLTLRQFGEGRAPPPPRRHIFVIWMGGESGLSTLGESDRPTRTSVGPPPPQDAMTQAIASRIPLPYPAQGRASVKMKQARQANK